MTNNKFSDAINSKLSCNEVLDGKIIRTFSINSSSNEKVKIYNDINKSNSFIAYKIKKKLKFRKF
ncbi:hypothetical protein [Mycoplasma phocimorsus]|uniref:hypothetical protein n=1 Tax=Mycoplasma phocimorsus TaxID=3045839 RepID=UPI0024C0014D|nr:hypothetical protein [Mycoplasma phocimorsus]MDJ1646144.1 hypothetical protein [Mycoplasma phocimorsus]